MINTMARQGVFTVAAAGNANNYNGVGDTYSGIRVARRMRLRRCRWRTPTVRLSRLTVPA